MTRTLLLTLLAATCTLVVGCPGSTPPPQTRTFDASLDGDQEIPAVNTDATGTGTFTLNSTTGELDFQVTFTGLSGPIVSAHLHNAPAGQEAGISEDLSAAFLADTTSPVTGSATLDAGQIAELGAGNLYINLHTAANPDGEIRGQLDETP